MSEPIHAQNLEHLKDLVFQAMVEQGPLCNLNHIDVSAITAFTGLFINSNFNGDISQWDMSNAIITNYMFMDSKFNGNLAGWRLPKLQDATEMFKNSNFDGDVSQWGVHVLREARGMFNTPAFQQDLSNWTFHEKTRPSKMVHPSYRNVLPQRGECFAFHYIGIMGESYLLDQYLRETSFSHVHASLMALTPAHCANWSSPETIQWATEQLEMYDTLGLSLVQKEHLLKERYHQRNTPRTELEVQHLDHALFDSIPSKM